MLTCITASAMAAWHMNYCWYKFTGTSDGFDDWSDVQAEAAVSSISPRWHVAHVTGLD
jgi:hypothetical protein